MLKKKRYPGYAEHNLLEEVDTYNRRENIYEAVAELRNYRSISGKSGGLKYYLSNIASEIRHRSLIIKQEIFLIGELLHYASEIIKSDKTIDYSFREWVKTNCAFSYSTALNFRRVYLVCGARLNDVPKIPLNVLYKISSKTFPDDLRKFIFESGGLEGMTLSRLDALITTYEKFGLERFEEDSEKLFSAVVDDEIRRVGVHKSAETINFLKSQKNKLKSTDNRKIISQKVGYENIVDHVEDYLEKSFDKCIEKLQALSDELEPMGVVYDEEKSAYFRNKTE